MPRVSWAFLTRAFTTSSVSFTTDTNFLYSEQAAHQPRWLPGKMQGKRVGTWGDVVPALHHQGLLSTKPNWEEYPFSPPDIPKTSKADKMTLSFPVWLVAETGVGLQESSIIVISEGQIHPCFSLLSVSWGCGHNT